MHMRQIGTISLLLGCLVAAPATGCDGGTSDTTGPGGDGGSAGAATTGGDGGSGGATGGSATGGSATGGGDTGGGGTGGMAASMTLTSPELTEGAMMPIAYTCAGKNVSPQLDWTAGPAGTMSYTVVFEDESIHLLHWAIRDIPADATGLPTTVETAASPSNVPGAQQSLSYDGQTYGYLGPCPNGNLHTYKFTVYAVDVAKLPVAGIGGADSVRDLAVEHQLASAGLTVQSDAKQ